MTQQIMDLQNQRAKVVAQMRAFGDERKWDTAAEDWGGMAKFEKDIADFNAQISQLEREAQLESNIVEASKITGDTEGKRASATFEKFVRFGAGALSAEDRAVLQPKGAMGVGTEVVPTTWAAKIVTIMKDLGTMRKLAYVFSSDTDKSIPIENAAVTGYWVAEAGTFTDSTPTFSSVTIGDCKAGALVKVSEELLADSAYNIEEYISMQFAEQFALLTEQEYINGTISGRPTGFLSSASLGLTSTVTASFTTGDIIDLFVSVKEPYRGKGVWLCGDKFYADLLKMKDGDGQYIFRLDGVTGVGSMFGKTLYTSPKMPGASSYTSGDFPIAFGDFKQYWICDRAGMTMQRLNELYATNGQVGFRGMLRTDGKTTYAGAIKTLKIL